MTKQATEKIILGIDPGFADTGFGVIKKMGAELTVLDYGSIKTPAGEEFSRRLLYIHSAVTNLIKRYRPECVAVEELFFYKNITTAIKVSQARGTVLLAAAQAKTRVMEFTPLQVKQGLTGYGGAAKKQMGQMVKIVLKLDTIPKPDDAADALAIAVCAASSLRVKSLL
ncbi:MAG: crossover junction endodeoxyribonuclease RuvC [Candidatus Komeilibacteria bacterium]|nr:crossover junction endodeoxyribonuclease RuvC [Candidatus Komeilibacteria bacterium]